MKMVFIVFTLLLLAIGFLSCVTNENNLNEKNLPDLEGKVLLNQQDLIEIFSEKRVATFSFGSGNMATAYYFPDGTQRIAGEKGMDEGKYKIEKGQLCSKWKKIRKGKEECYKIYRSEGNKFILIKPDGSSDSTMVFKEIF